MRVVFCCSEEPARKRSKSSNANANVILRKDSRRYYIFPSTDVFRNGRCWTDKLDFGLETGKSKNVKVARETVGEPRNKQRLIKRIEVVAIPIRSGWQWPTIWSIVPIYLSRFGSRGYFYRCIPVYLFQLIFRTPQHISDIIILVIIRIIINNKW